MKPARPPASLHEVLDAYDEGPSAPLSHVALVNGWLGEHGLGPLDADDAVVLEYRGEHVVVLLEGDLVVVTAPVMDMPTKGKRVIYEELLALSGGAMGEAALVLTPDRKRVMLRVARAVEGLDDTQLVHCIEVIGEAMFGPIDELRRRFGVERPA